MTTKSDCTPVQECLEEILNTDNGLTIGGSTVGAAIVAALSVASGGSLTPAAVGIVGGLIADNLNSGEQSFSFDSLKQANLSDVYRNIIGGQDLRAQIENDPFVSIADNAVRSILEGLRQDSDSIDNMYAAILEVSGITDMSLIEEMLEFTQNRPIDEQEGQIANLIEDYGLSLVQSQAIWFASALKSGRIQEFLQDTSLARIIDDEFSVFMFQEYEGFDLEAERRQLLIDSALWKHPQSPEEFWDMENLLDSQELSNYLIALQNPSFLPQYSDPSQSAILNSILSITNDIDPESSLYDEAVQQQQDLIRLYTEGGWAIEATLGDDEARTFEGDNEEALYQAFIDNPELIRTPILAELFADGEVRDSFVSMLLSVNEEEGSVLFGDRVDGLLAEAVNHAVTERLEQYGIVLPEIQGDTYGSTDLIQAHYPLVYGNQHIGYTRDQWGNLIFSPNRIDQDIPLAQQHYRTTLDDLPLIGPHGYDSVYPLAMFSHIPQETAQHPGFWNIPSNDPEEASAYRDQQTAQAVAGAGLPPGANPDDYIRRSELNTEIGKAVGTELEKIGLKDVDLSTKINDEIDKRPEPKCECHCSCGDNKNVSNDRWEDTPEAMAGDPRPSNIV